MFREEWPRYDEALAREDAARIVVQVNGKLRGHLEIPFGSAEADVKQRALELDKVQPFITGKQVVKIIVLADKLVNIVVK